MSLESNVGREFLNIVDVLKIKLVTAIAETNNELQLSPEQLAGIQATIATTVDKAGMQSVDVLTKLVSNR